MLVMEDLMLRDIKRNLAEFEKILSIRTRRYKDVSKYSDALLKYGSVRGDTVYFKARFPEDDDFRYIGSKANVTVRRIQEERFLRESIKTLKNNIELMEEFLKEYESIGFDHINSKLPKTYRNSFAAAASSNVRKANVWKTNMEQYKARFPVVRPEELVQPTIDGKYVRTKSELLIYNYLYEAGYTFVYELPIDGKFRMFYPDFTILSEIDYLTLVRIEHQGMMSDPFYKDKSEVREYDYWKEGYLPSRDVYFTYDDNKGGFDIGPIVEILESRVRPI